MSNTGMPAMYNGEYFDSRTEAVWAAYFEIVGMPYVREPNRYKLGPLPVYTPDFYLPEQDTFVEIKNGNIDTSAVLRAYLLAKGLGKTVLLIDGKPIRMDVYVFGGGTQKSPDYSKPVPYFTRNLADRRYYFRPNAINPSSTEQKIMSAAHQAEASVAVEFNEVAYQKSKKRKGSLIPQIITFE